MLDERVVHDGPIHTEVGYGLRYDPALLGDRAPSSVRSRVVSLERARTAGSDSVNEARGHSRSLQRNRRLCQISRNTLVP